MQNKQRFRPSAMSILTVTLVTCIFLAAVTALPVMRTGKPSLEAMIDVLRDSSFWTGQMLYIGVMYVLMLVIFPSLYERLIRVRKASHKYPLSYSRNRWLVTICGASFIVVTSVAIILQLVRGTKSFTTDQLIFLVLVWLIYGCLIAYTWLHKPSPEWVEGFETGNRSRGMDERYQVVMGKSAVTTLYWTMGLLLVGGSFYELLVNRTWPIRSLAEIILIFTLWNVLYHRVDKTL